MTAGASVLLLRHLGVASFGRYITVTSLVAIVGGLADAGLSAIGARDLALRSQGAERDHVLANLLGLRLLITPLGVAGATVFAVVAGYGWTLVAGTALAGIGLILATYQGTMTLPLSIDLRIGRLTATEVTKQAATLLGIALLVGLGASLLPFFALSIFVGAAAIAATPALVGSRIAWRPEFDRTEASRLMREALPFAAAVVVGILYFRVLVILVSLLASPMATGLFATSFRVCDLLYSLSSVVVSIALPVLAIAATNPARLSYMLQRMIEASTIASAYLALIVFILAEPALDLLGGRQYRGAAPVLRIEIFALIPQFVAQICIVGLIAIRRQSLQAVGSGVAAVAVIALGGALIPLYAAKGAAVAALIAEAGFAALLILLLTRAEHALRLNFVFAWKVALAALPGVGAMLVPSFPRAAAAATATVGYLLVLSVTRAVPREVVDAFIVRRGN